MSTFLQQNHGNGLTSSTEQLHSICLLAFQIPPLGAILLHPMTEILTTEEFPAK